MKFLKFLWGWFLITLFVGAVIGATLATAAFVAAVILKILGVSLYG